MCGFAGGEVGVREEVVVITVLIATGGGAGVGIEVEGRASGSPR